VNQGRRLLRILKKKGTDPRKNHAIEFYVYFSAKASALKARAVLKKKRFHVELLRDSSSRRWICLSIAEMLPAHRAILRVQRELGALVKPMGGVCEGWGTQMER
jgi:Regulator of ribonuclease activity B